MEEETGMDEKKLEEYEKKEKMQKKSLVLLIKIRLVTGRIK